MKRTFPLFLGFVFGLFMMLDLLVPHPLLQASVIFLRESFIIIAVGAILLGIANVLRVNYTNIRRGTKDTPYRIILLVSFAAMSFVGIAGGYKSGSAAFWLWENMQLPCGATMFALLAFYIASAAFRAFRIRNLEAGFLMAAAVLLMIGRVPLVELAFPNYPEFVEWIMDAPNMAAKRAIMIGAALGAIATGLKIILGIERQYLGMK